MAYKITPAQLQAKWAQYRKLCDEHVQAVRYRGDIVDLPKRIIYSIDGFCNFAAMEEADLQVLEANKNFKATVRLIRYTVLARKLEALVNGEGSTTGLIFDLKANYGLYPKRRGDLANDWLVSLNLGKDELQSQITVAGAQPEIAPVAGQDVQPVVEAPAAPMPPVLPAKPDRGGVGYYSVW